jgi:tetratricopeptide (TPR) repeat protein
MTWPRCRWLAAAAAVSAAALLPVLGLVPFHFQFFSTVADHYLYLAMLGPGLAAGWAVTRWPRPAGAAAVVALALCAAGTAAQLRHWRDDQALFTHTLSVNPRSFAALNMLGAAELDAAERLASVQPPAAAAHASRAAELFAAAAQLNPEFIQAHENLGYVLVTRMQRPDAAIGPLRTALELRHRYRETRGGHDIVGLYTLLARTLEQSGDAAAATEVRRLLHDLTEDARAAAPHAGAS